MDAAAAGGCHASGSCILAYSSSCCSSSGYTALPTTGVSISILFSLKSPLKFESSLFQFPIALVPTAPAAVSTTPAEGLNASEAGQQSTAAVLPTTPTTPAARPVAAAAATSAARSPAAALHPTALGAPTAVPPTPAATQPTVLATASMKRNICKMSPPPEDIDDLFSVSEIGEDGVEMNESDGIPPPMCIVPDDSLPSPTPAARSVAAAAASVAATEVPTTPAARPAPTVAVAAAQPAGYNLKKVISFILHTNQLFFAAYRLSIRVHFSF